MAWTDHLPEWASIEKRYNRFGSYEMWIAVDADAAYKKILPLIGEGETQEALTLARHVLTRKLKKIMYAHGGKPPMRIHIIDKSKKWALDNFPLTGKTINKNKLYKRLNIYDVKPEPEVPF
jgi:hypothetical protein